MTKLKLILPVIFLTLLFSCEEEGIPGPPGPEGPQGPAGVPGEIGFVFEYENLDFTAPEYRLFLPYPEDFTGYDSDVALVYFLWDVETVDGEDSEVWRQLPQTVITENGILQYNFDFSKQDVSVFLDAEFPLDQLTAMDTDDWIARVVVVPGEFWDTAARIDFSDYAQVKEMLGLPDFAPHAVTKRRKAE